MSANGAAGDAVTRRTAIKVGVGVAGAALGTDAFLSLGRRAIARQTYARGSELRPPTVLSSHRGKLRVRLICRPAVVDLGAPMPVTTYTYDGVVPGYTWELRPGDLLRVDLVNELPPLADDGEMRMDRPHKWTTTNLHTHGLHVSPSGIADNVFLMLPPGERQRHRIHLPEDHPPGLFWYHPHHHGAVTQQVRGGMAGLIIVRGDIDEVPEVRAAEEKILVLQSIELGDRYQLLDPIPNPTKEQAFFPRTNVLYTVNGKLGPTITMRPGEVQRWRLLNAAEGKFLSLRLEEHELNVLAWDGLTLREPEGTEVVMLSSGNRVEFLVKARRPGRYELMLTPGSSQKPNIPGMPTVAAHPLPVRGAGSQTFLCNLAADNPAVALADQPPELQPRSIATLLVRGHEEKMHVPRSLPAYDPPIRHIVKRRRVNFTVARDPSNEFISFGIDGVAFDPTNPPYRAQLGTAEEWTVVNDCDTKLMDHAHVFHIHVNPFKVTAINGRRLTTPLWRDTWVLTKNSGDSFTMETNFDDFTGKFVQHCHVLSHEDLGMMEAVEVVS